MSAQVIERTKREWKIPSTFEKTFNESLEIMHKSTKGFVDIEGKKEILLCLTNPSNTIPRFIAVFNDGVEARINVACFNGVFYPEYGYGFSTLPEGTRVLFKKDKEFIVGDYKVDKTAWSHLDQVWYYKD
jgi:hypothetical protein